LIPHRSSDAARIEAFSDAMIGFAATILVVSLDAPRTFDDLIANLWGFIPFALSFLALFFIWYCHTILFRRYPLTDGWSIAINGVLLFTVLFYVHPLKFMASSFVSRFSEVKGAAVSSWDQLQSLFIIYDAGWIVVFVLFALLYWRAYSTRARLGLSAIEAYDAITFSRHYIGFVLAGLISLGVAISGIGLGFGLAGIVYSSIGFFAWLNGEMRAPGRRALEAADRARIPSATLQGTPPHGIPV
jgi:uncharacterized membrane protein